MNYGLADLALARRLEGCSAWAGAESARAFARINPASGAEATSIGGGVAAWFGPGSPLTQAQGLGLEGPVTDLELERLDNFFSTRGGAGSIEVSSLADGGLLPALSRRGYIVGEQTHMLVRPAILEKDPVEDVEGLSISIVADSASPDQAILAETVLRGFFEGPGEPPEGIGEVIGALTSAPNSSGWLARLLGEPAGGAVIVTHQGVALLAGDATMPGFRRRGVQSALIRARTIHAAKIGCDLVAACTGPGTISQRNYERQGFRVVYARTLMVRNPSPDPALGIGA